MHLKNMHTNSQLLAFIVDIYLFVQRQMSIISAIIFLCSKFLYHIFLFLLTLSTVLRLATLSMGCFLFCNYVHFLAMRGKCNERICLSGRGCMHLGSWKPETNISPLTYFLATTWLRGLFCSNHPLFFLVLFTYPSTTFPSTTIHPTITSTTPPQCSLWVTILLHLVPFDVNLPRLSASAY